MPSAEYWNALDQLIESSRIEIDRPAGSIHPRHADVIYPLDYGYLVETRAADGAGVDVWIGTAGHRRLVGLIMTVDASKRDVEQKLLLGCTNGECRTLEAFHTGGGQTGWLLTR